MILRQIGMSRPIRAPVAVRLSLPAVRLSRPLLASSLGKGSSFWCLGVWVRTAPFGPKSCPKRRCARSGPSGQGHRNRSIRGGKPQIVGPNRAVRTLRIAPRPPRSGPCASRGSQIAPPAIWLPRETARSRAGARWATIAGGARAKSGDPPGHRFDANSGIQIPAPSPWPSNPRPPLRLATCGEDRGARCAVEKIAWGSQKLCMAS